MTNLSAKSFPVFLICAFLLTVSHANTAPKEKTHRETTQRGLFSATPATPASWRVRWSKENNNINLLHSADCAKSEKRRSIFLDILVCLKALI